MPCFGINVLLRPALTHRCISTSSHSPIFTFNPMAFRTEKDTMGTVQVPATAYWGAQTQRSIENFPIAQDINRMPKEIIAAFAYL